MVVDYLADAMDGSYEPTFDHDENLRPERVAAFLLFLYAELDIAPTASVQISNTPDQSRLRMLERVVTIHLCEPELTDDRLVRTHLRTVELRRRHANEPDCSIVAEAEVLGYDAVVTFDRNMRRRLGPHARVRVLSPSEAWDIMEVPRGEAPIRRPSDTNPKVAARWWNWN